MKAKAPAPGEPFDFFPKGHPKAQVAGDKRPPDRGLSLERRQHGGPAAPKAGKSHHQSVSQTPPVVSPKAVPKALPKVLKPGEREEIPDDFEIPPIPSIRSRTRRKKDPPEPGVPRSSPRGRGGRGQRKH
jgi:hypothetical protein